MSSSAAAATEMTPLRLRALAGVVINGALAFEVPGSGFAINQTFLALTTLYIVIPSVMVAVSVLGESWVYYLIGSAVEMVLLAAIAWATWTWPRQAAPAARPSLEVDAGRVPVV